LVRRVDGMADIGDVTAAIAAALDLTDPIR
jgi:hypothetical protein